MPEQTAFKKPTGLAVFLIVAAAIGSVAAWALTFEKFALLEDPDAQLACDINLLVGCGKNLNSAAGAVFGFPNPLIGIAAWAIVITVAFAILAGSRFASWFWVLFALGTAGALALVTFFITASVTTVGSLCPWCMATWVVTIPTFWTVWFYVLKEGHIPLPAAGRRFFKAAYGWVPLVTFLSYVVVAIIAQVRLEWIPNAFI